MMFTARKDGYMAASAGYAPSEEMIDVVIHSSKKLEGAAKIIAMLEGKANAEQVTPSELAAVRCVVESCASDLGSAWERA